MKHSTRAIRAAIATGALGTALLVGIAPAAAGGGGPNDPCVIKVGTGAGRALDPCYTPATRPEDTTTTTEAQATTTTTETEATTTGWVLSLKVGPEGVRSWRTHVARLDADGVPHPAPAVASPCGRAGDGEVRQCTGAP